MNKERFGNDAAEKSALKKKVKYWYSEQIRVHRNFLYDLQSDFIPILYTMSMLFIDAANRHFEDNIIRDSYEVGIFEEDEDNILRNKVTIRFSAFGYVNPDGNRIV